eukprot:Gregarina_sp_Poly_1__4273@NODE_2326_length_2291_cov_60_365558_g1489_i0_p2_GENE_NODE_2326_length_2291_cov_60_365558_g1489_i0NODE_2326_length_2291_cov_60_365558_g1489_i0_p2_ORF_typecomplete_len246_score39_52_NODE_2326_length_2291_cov_60_365558_g1489_i067804
MHTGRKRLQLLRRSAHGHVFFDEVLVGEGPPPADIQTTEVIEMGVQGPDKPKPTPPRMPHSISVSVETRPAPPDRPTDAELEFTKNAKQLQAVSNPPANWLRRRRCPPVSRPRNWKARAVPLLYKSMDSDDEQARILRSRRRLKYRRKKALVAAAVENWKAAMQQRLYGTLERHDLKDRQRLRREGDAALDSDYLKMGKLHDNMRRAAFTRVRGGRRHAFRLERQLLPAWREPYDTHKEAVRITL